MDSNKDNKNNINLQLAQPPLVSPVPACQRNMTLPLMADTNSDLLMSNDLDVSEEELKDLLSQKDLATTLAENLLKHFEGSEDIDIKEDSKGNTIKKYIDTDLYLYSMYFFRC